MPDVSLSNGTGSGGRPDALVTGILAAVSVFLLETGPHVEMAVSEVVRGTVLRPILDAQDWFDRRAALEERLNDLVDDNVRLQADLLERRELDQENRQLRRLLEMPEAGADGEYVPSELSPADPRLGVTRRFVLPVGRSRGLRAPSGVVTADGVVGVVRAVTADGAVGDFWTHPDFRISVRVGEREITGIVRPEERDGQRPAMVFGGAPYQDEVPPGSVLLTTGAGGVFPPGIPVGTVREQISAEAGWARNYRVRPSIRPEEVSVALVWLPPSDGPGG